MSEALYELRKMTLGASWRTSLVGCLVLVIAVATSVVAVLDGDPKTVLDIEAILAALAGLGLVAARDNRVSSEAAGARPAYTLPVRPMGFDGDALARSTPQDVHVRVNNGTAHSSGSRVGPTVYTEDGA